jgi:hypothetical protein
MKDETEVNKIAIASVKNEIVPHLEEDHFLTDVLYILRARAQLHLKAYVLIEKFFKLMFALIYSLNRILFVLILSFFN